MREPKEFREPFYRIVCQGYRNGFIVAADEIGESGDNDDVKARYRVISYIELGFQKTFWPYGGPAGFLRFNVRELEDIIKATEGPHSIANDEKINAFRFGRLTGRMKDWYFEVPVEFYRIEVGKKF